MAEAVKLIYEYCLLRYVPDIERGEFINVGLLMMCKRTKWLNCRLNIDTQALNVLFNSDTEFIKNQIKVFERKDVPNPELPVEEKYRWMAAVKSAIIQTSQSHSGLIFCELENAETLLNEKFDYLFNRLVARK